MKHVVLYFNTNTFVLNSSSLSIRLWQKCIVNSYIFSTAFMKFYESIKYPRNLKLYYLITLLLWNSNHLKSCSLFPLQTLKFGRDSCILPLVPPWFRGQPADGTFRKLGRKILIKRKKKLESSIAGNLWIPSYPLLILSFHRGRKKHSSATRGNHWSQQDTSSLWHSSWAF